MVGEIYVILCSNPQTTTSLCFSVLQLSQCPFSLKFSFKVVFQPLTSNFSLPERALKTKQEMGTRNKPVKSSEFEVQG